MTDAERARRYREANPDVVERDNERRRRSRQAQASPEFYAAERDRIADYRARNPAKNYLTNLRAKRRSEARSNVEGDE